MNRRVLYSFGLITFVFVTASLVSRLTNPPSALGNAGAILVQGDQTPSPTLIEEEELITILENRLATQEAQIDALQHDLERHRASVDFELRDLRWQIDSRLFIAGAIVLILGFFGYRTFRQIDATLHNRISATLNKELYRLDPTMLTIRIRRGRELLREYRRMELSGLRNIDWYSDFSKECARGVTIVPVDDESDEQEFLKFLDAYDLDPSEAAFVLYARERKVPSQVIDAYDNLTIANNPTSLASAVLVVGRGLNP